ncbi:DUF6059 family protein [Streptomyces sp. NPDC059092]|uniref:DUF6059 family protein n=1 Tax=Streptomyces sp. NPDC059092 TaxID=3346725 RepID=UPI0036824A52
MTKLLLYPGFCGIGHDGPMRSSLSRLLRMCANALIAYGQVYVVIPSPDVAEPVQGDPERKSCERPLTDTERALARQLEGM